MNLDLPYLPFIELKSLCNFYAQLKTENQMFFTYRNKVFFIGNSCKINFFVDTK